jgi:hypothetical protein
MTTAICNGRRLKRVELRMLLSECECRNINNERKSTKMTSPDLMELVSLGVSKGLVISIQLIIMFAYISICDGMLKPSKYFVDWFYVRDWNWRKRGAYYFHCMQFAPVIAFLITSVGHGGSCDFDGSYPCSDSDSTPTSPDEDFVTFIKFTVIMLVVHAYAAKVRLKKYTDDCYEKL